MDKKSEQIEKEKNHGQIVLAMAKVVFNMIALVFKRIKAFVFNFPACSTTFNQLDHIIFVDDNIVGYGSESRQQAMALFKGIVDRGIEKSWFCQASVNIGDDPELLEWAARAGSAGPERGGFRLSPCCRSLSTSRKVPTWPMASSKASSMG